MADSHDDGKQDTIGDQHPEHVSSSEQQTSRLSHVSEVTKQSSLTPPNEDMAGNGEGLSGRNIAEPRDNDQRGKEDDTSHQAVSSSSDEDESVNDQDSDIRDRPLLQKNTTSYAAHTKASEAKKDENLERHAFSRSHSPKEFPSQQGTAMQQPVPTSNSRRSSPPRGTDTVDENRQRDDDIESESKVLSLSKRRGTRRLSPVDVARAQTLNQWRKAENEASPSLEERGPSRQSMDSHVAAFDERNDDTSGNGKDEVGNGGVEEPIESYDIVLGECISEKGNECIPEQENELSSEKDELEDRLEVAVQTLQTVQEEKEKLNQEHSELLVRLNQLQEQITQRNLREPVLPRIEVVEAERDNIRKEVRKLEKILSKKSKELAENVVEVTNAEEFACQVQKDTEAIEKRIGKLETGVDAVCSAMEELGQNMSQMDEKIGWKHWKLLEDLKEDPAIVEKIEELRDHFYVFSRGVSTRIQFQQDQNQMLENKLNEAVHKLSIREKAKVAEEDENMSPLSPGWGGKVIYENLYKEEKEKLKAAEGKLRRFQAEIEKKGSEKIENMQNELTESQAEKRTLLEEKETLSQKLGESELLVRDLKKDIEAANSRFQQREDAFEQKLQEHRNKIQQYIKEYYDKTQAPTYWEATNLKSSDPRQFNGEPTLSSQDMQEKRKAILAEQIEERRRAREDNDMLDRIIKKLRKRKMGNFYPPRKTEWMETREKSAWERWGGDEWAKKQLATDEEERFLRIKGLWPEEN